MKISFCFRMCIAVAMVLGILLIPFGVQASPHYVEVVSVSVVVKAVWSDNSSSVNCESAKLTVFWGSDPATPQPPHSLDADALDPDYLKGLLSIGDWIRYVTGETNECIALFQNVELAKSHLNQLTVQFVAVNGEGETITGAKTKIVRVGDIVINPFPPRVEISDIELNLSTSKTLQPPQSILASPKATIRVPSLNVRRGPGVRYGVFGVATQGTELIVIERDTSTGWLKICCVDGQEGWISGSSQYVTVVNTTGSASQITQPSGSSGQTQSTPSPAQVTTGTNSSQTANVVSVPGLITSFERWGTWRRGDEPYGQFVQSSEEKHGGQFSGKFIFDLPANRQNFVVYRQTIPIAGQPSGLKMWVYGDGSGVFLNVWLEDAKGQRWQFGFGRINHFGWQEMIAPFNLVAGWPNGPVGEKQVSDTINYPLSLFALVIDGVDDYDNVGTVYFDDLTAVEGTITREIASAPSPTPTPPSSPPQQLPTTVSVSFRADQTNLNSGECTWLYWDVDNVREIYLDGRGVAGHDRAQVCPTANQTVQLTVVYQDGARQVYPITLQVSSTPSSSPSQPVPQPPSAPSDSCGDVPNESYGSLTVSGAPSDRPAEAHADLNLALRGYAPTSAEATLKEFGPPKDPNAPQLRFLFADQTKPLFTGTYQVYDWDWSCNCRGSLLSHQEVTLLGMAVAPGESIAAPDSGYSIGDGYEVLVLYADSERITLKYTREDNVVVGFTIHVEGVCVEPRLLSLYQTLNQEGRSRLPALRPGQALGRAKGNELKVAVRDGGVFFDPRHRQNWWQGQ